MGVPSACRKNESTISILVKALISSKIAGASVTIVRIATTRSMGTRSSGFSESAIFIDNRGIDFVPVLALTLAVALDCDVGVDFCAVVVLCANACSAFIAEGTRAATIIIRRAKKRFINAPQTACF